MKFLKTKKKWPLITTKRIKQIIFILIIFWQFFLVTGSKAICLELGNTGCSKDSDCCDSRICIVGTCSSCKEDSDCYSYKAPCQKSTGRCNVGNPGGGVNLPCKTISDCTTGQACKDGFCQNVGKDYKCKDNSECPKDNYCENNICKLFPDIPEKKLLPWNASAPTINIRIPGLTFADIQNSMTTDEDGNKYINIPWIGQYITSVYSFSVAIVSIVAVFIIMIQGLLVMTSGGGERKMAAYKKIGQVAIGLAIMWGSYAILYNINPELVKFKALKVRYIKNIPLEDYNLYPDDLPEDNAGESWTERAPLNSAKLSEVKNKGCGKNLSQIAQAYADQQICQGPLHCANFVSRVLIDSGCDASYKNNSAGGLAQVLIKKGWKLKKGRQGVAAGDIVFWNKNGKPDNHVAVAVSDTEIIDSAGGTIKSCWPANLIKEINAACGDYNTNFLAQRKGPETPEKIKTVETYSKCVASNGGCSPAAKLYQESCNYCAKIGPTDEFLAIAVKLGHKISTHQCISKRAISDWAFYVVNPNK